jgi:hypothetical protein
METSTSVLGAIDADITFIQVNQAIDWFITYFLTQVEPSGPDDLSSKVSFWRMASATSWMHSKGVWCQKRSEWF